MFGNHNGDSAWVVLLALLFFCRGGWDGRHHGEGSHYERDWGRESVREQQFNRIEIDGRLNRLSDQLQLNQNAGFAYANHKETNAEMRDIGNKITFGTFNQQRDSDKNAWLMEKNTGEITRAIHEEGCKTREQAAKYFHIGQLNEKDEIIRSQAAEIQRLQLADSEDRIVNRINGSVRAKEEFRELENSIVGRVINYVEERLERGVKAREPEVKVVYVEKEHNHRRRECA